MPASTVVARDYRRATRPDDQDLKFSKIPVSQISFNLSEVLPKAFIPLAREAAENPVDGSTVIIDKNHPYDGFEGRYILAYFLKGSRRVPLGMIRILSGGRNCDRLGDLTDRRFTMSKQDRFIDQLFISPKSQGMGLGRVLLSLAVMDAVSAGAKSVYSDPIDCPRWMSFFLTLGFKELEKVSCSWVQGLNSKLSVVKMDGSVGIPFDPELIGTLIANYRSLVHGLDKIHRYGCDVALDRQLMTRLKNFILKIYIPEGLCIESNRL